MSKLIDLTGQKFGYLTVIKIAPKDKLKRNNRSSVWECICECGNIVYTTSNDLKTGNTKSCGCKKYGHRKLYNKYDLTGEFGIGYINDNENFYFDIEDYNKIKDIYWKINPNGYIQGIDTKTKKKKYIHRIIMDPPDNMQIDHINHNKLDNRKSNLRIVTSYENNLNKTFDKEYIGVYQCKNGKWFSHITRHNITYSSKVFDTKEEAINWRNKKEQELNEKDKNCACYDH